MSKVDELCEAEAELSQYRDEIRNLKADIHALDKKKSDDYLRNSFLEENRSDLQRFRNVFFKNISELEKKRDKLLKEFKEKSIKIAKIFDETHKRFFKERAEINNALKKQKLGEYKLLPSTETKIKKVSFKLFDRKLERIIHGRIESDDERLISSLREIFISMHKLDEAETLVLDKHLCSYRKFRLGFITKFIKKGLISRNIFPTLYQRFIQKFNLNEDQRLIFDAVKFKKIKDYPSVIYSRLEDLFIERNGAKFKDFCQVKIMRIDNEIDSIQKETSSKYAAIEGLNRKIEEIKKYICPMCNGGKRSNRKYCSVCWAKIRGSGRRVWNSDYYESDFVDTEISPSRECVMCGAPLKTRRKYCSDCWPRNRSKPFWAPKEERFVQYEKNVRNNERVNSWLNSLPRAKPSRPTQRTSIFSAPVQRSPFVSALRQPVQRFAQTFSRAPSSQIRMPRVSMPKISMPRISAPRILMPRVSMPKVSILKNPFGLKRAPRSPITLRRNPGIGW